MTPTSSKLPRLQRRFLELYNIGTTYSQIASQLGVHVMTVMEWRKKLGLPRRVESSELNRVKSNAWWDTPIMCRKWNESSRSYRAYEKPPQEIIESLASPLSLAPGDVRAVLTRTVRLVQQNRHIGRPVIHLLLAQAFNYNRVVGRPPVGIRKFTKACEVAGYHVEAREIMRLVAEMPRSRPLLEPRPPEAIRRQEYVLKRELGLNGDTVNKAIEIAQAAEVIYTQAGRTPTSTALAAAALYLASRFYSEGITQKKISEYFGITEVTVRNVQHLMEMTLEVRALLNKSNEEPESIA